MCIRDSAVADEIGFILHPGLFVHAQETLVLLACQANVIAVYARVVEGFAAAAEVGLSAASIGHRCFEVTTRE